MPLQIRIRETHLSGTIDPKRYRRELIGVMNQVGDLKVEALDRTLDTFEALRKSVVETLSTVTAESAPLYQATLAQIDDAIAEFGRRYGIDLQSLLNRGFDLGEQLAVKPISAAGRIDVLDIGRGLTQAQIEIISSFSADLVQGLTVDLRKRINTEVAAVFTGAQNPFQAATKIGRNLTSRNHFATMFHRARTIVVTEIGRAQAVSTQRSQEELKRTLENAGDDTVVRKRLINAHLPGARQTHLDAERRYSPGGSPGPIPVDELYTIAGEQALYPRDPSLSVGNSANCHCVSITVLDDQDPVGEGEQRKALDKAIAKPAKPDPRPPVDQRPLWERDNDRRRERLREPLSRPGNWDQMSSTKRLRWLEDTMEADFPRSGPAGIQPQPVKMTRRQRMAFKKTHGRLPSDAEAVVQTVDIDLNKTTFDLVGTDPDLMVPQLNRLRELATKYPEVAKDLKYFGTHGSEKSTFFSAKAGTLKADVIAGVRGAGGEQMVLNPRFFSSQSLLETNASTGFATGFKSTDGLTRTVTHEWGHLVDSWVSQQTDGRDLILRVLGGESRDVLAASKISDYATANTAENWAELFAAAEAPAGASVSTTAPEALDRMTDLLTTLRSRP